MTPGTAAVCLAALLVAPTPSAQVPPAEPPVLGGAAGWSVTEETATLAIAAGTALRAEPAAGSRLLEVLPESALPVLASRGRWLQVRFGETVGWVDPQAAPVPRATPPSAKTGLRDRAEELLGPAAATTAAGPFELLSDLPATRLRRRLKELAAALPGFYAERYGLASPRSAAGSVAVFARSEAYRAFAAAFGDGREEEIAGFARPGWAALASEGRSEPELLATFVHELTHLLNRAALGPDPPPWLDEGLADDVALALSGPGGGLTPGDLVPRGLHRGQRIVLAGPLSSLPGLLHDLGRGRPLALAAVLGADRPAFLDPAAGPRLRTVATFWVRYLLASRSGLADGFRAYLATVAELGAGDPATLEDHLGHGGTELEAGFRSWLESLPAQLGLPPESLP